MLQAIKGIAVSSLMKYCQCWYLISVQVIHLSVLGHTSADTSDIHDFTQLLYWSPQGLISCIMLLFKCSIFNLPQKGLYRKVSSHQMLYHTRPYQVLQCNIGVSVLLDLILVPRAYVGIGHGLGIIVYLGSIYDRSRTFILGWMSSSLSKVCSIMPHYYVGQVF